MTPEQAMEVWGETLDVGGIGMVPCDNPTCPKCQAAAAVILAAVEAETRALREAGEKIAGQLRVMFRDDDVPVSSYEWLTMSEEFLKQWGAARALLANQQETN